MTIESLKQDLDASYEGETGVLEVESYWCEYRIEGDNENMLNIHYKNGVEIDRKIEPKKVYAWERK